MKSRKPFIIAIAAVSGGGKTTITTQLNQKFPKSKALYFDEYDFEGPEDILGWVERGADCHEWNLSPMLNDLISMLTVSPKQQLDFIFLDYPFAYMHKYLKEYINLTVFIDTPLDIAMARRVLRDYKNSSVIGILNDLENYLSRGRKAYLNMLTTIKPNSDLIIDGTLPLDEIVKKISSNTGYIKEKPNRKAL